MPPEGSEQLSSVMPPLVHDHRHTPSTPMQFHFLVPSIPRHFHLALGRRILDVHEITAVALIDCRTAVSIPSAGTSGMSSSVLFAAQPLFVVSSQTARTVLVSGGGELYAPTSHAFEPLGGPVWDVNWAQSGS